MLTVPSESLAEASIGMLTPRLNTAPLVGDVIVTDGALFGGAGGGGGGVAAGPKTLTFHSEIPYGVARVTPRTRT